MLRSAAVGDLQAIQVRCIEEGVSQSGDEYVMAILERTEMLVRHPDADRIVNGSC
ncbi:MAG TPA: hypothetical protein VL020_00040 [Pseudomonadales bacterium]|nr:hypothetical protein [Pseudomonadales bacterium]